MLERLDQAGAVGDGQLLAGRLLLPADRGLVDDQVIERGRVDLGRTLGGQRPVQGIGDAAGGDAVLVMTGVAEKMAVTLSKIG